MGMTSQAVTTLKILN